MFKLSSILIAAALALSVVATPVSVELEKRGAVLSGQWDTEKELNGMYTLSQNLWGKASASSGSQTSQETSASGTTVAWKTTWNWQGGPYSVKSYANIGLNLSKGKQLKSIGSVPTTWKWSYNYSNSVVADVSYDLWLSNSATPGQANGASTYEIMIWLSARGGAGPIGGQIATVSIAGHSWNLHKGTNQGWTVLSFVATSEIPSFSADLKQFFNYLTSSQGVSSNSYLVGVSSGTEPFTGNAELTTSGFSVQVN